MLDFVFEHQSPLARRERERPFRDHDARPDESNDGRPNVVSEPNAIAMEHTFAPRSLTAKHRHARRGENKRDHRGRAAPDDSRRAVDSERPAVDANTPR